MVQLGVCYYPEHWDRSMWEEDARLMREAGIRIVRVAEFAWSRLEPREGEYDFAWLDDAIDVLHRQGLSVVIGTPTCTPPNWLTKRYPDVLPVDKNEHRGYAGVRGHRCFNSPSMREMARRIVTKLAAHYANHPAIIGWQIDNEFMLQMCHCEHCTRGFREWAKRKFSSLQELNQRWGLAVWSGEYSAWDEINPPLGGSPFVNPSYLLDYHRFQNQSIVEYQAEQVQILRKSCPKHMITHNSWGVPVPLDYASIYESLDLASYDYYPSTSPNGATEGPYSGALVLDLTRGFKRRNFWIMEQLSGPPGCWMPMWRTPTPGLIRAFAWQSISRGADVVVFFRWRSGSIGAEQFWHGIIDHSNVPGRRYREVCELGAEVNRVAGLLDGTSVRNEVAILYSYEHHTAMQLQNQADGLNYYDNLKLYHRTLAKQGVGVDVIDWRSDLSGYKAVMAPHLYLLDEANAARLEAYVRAGGTLILTPRTGVKDMGNVCWTRPLPGPLATCAGVVVDEYDPVGRDVHHMEFGGKTYECRQWCDILQPTTASTVGTYTDDFYTGKPAITLNRLDRGHVYYIGTGLDDTFYTDFWSQIISECGISALPGLPAGVHASIRRSDRAAYLFVLNLSRETHRITLPREYRSIISDTTLGSSLELAPYQVEIVEYQTAEQ